MKTYSYSYDDISKLFTDKRVGCLGVYEETMGLLSYDEYTMPSIVEERGPYITFRGTNSAFYLHKWTNQLIEVNEDGGLMVSSGGGKKFILYPVRKIPGNHLLEDIL